MCICTHTYVWRYIYISFKNFKSTYFNLKGSFTFPDCVAHSTHLVNDAQISKQALMIVLNNGSTEG